MLADRQRDARTGFQDPLRRGLVGPLVLVRWLPPGASGLCGLQRPSQDTRCDCSPPDPACQQGRAALHVLVAFDTQRCEMPATLEAVAEAFHAVGVTRAPHRIWHRPRRVPRMGDTGLPPTPLAVSRAGVFLTRAVRDGGAGWLAHALLAVHSAAPPVHVWGGRLALLCPDDAEQPLHPMGSEHAGHRLHARRGVGDVTVPPPAGGRQGRQGGLRMAQPCCQPRGLVGGMSGRAPSQPPCAPCLHAARRPTGPRTRRALGRTHRVPSGMGAPSLGALPRRAVRHPYGAPGVHGPRGRPGQRQRRHVPGLVPR
jgi:hypothetical protein